jgi:hypothetical protein
MSLEEKLRILMNSMKDWERKKLLETANVTVELVKLPTKQTTKSFKPSRLALHIKRNNSFKGIIIDDTEVLEDLVKALQSPKLRQLIQTLEKLNGAEKIELEL